MAGPVVRIDRDGKVSGKVGFEGAAPCVRCGVCRIEELGRDQNDIAVFARTHDNDRRILRCKFDNAVGIRLQGVDADESSCFGDQRCESVHATSLDRLRRVLEHDGKSVLLEESAHPELAAFHLVDAGVGVVPEVFHDGLRPDVVLAAEPDCLA